MKNVFHRPLLYIALSFSFLLFGFNGKPSSAAVLKSNVACNQTAESDTSYFIFKVWGTAACKTTIENIVKQNSFVITADYDAQENLLTITYLPEGYNPDNIINPLVNAGYDAELKRATEEAYNALSNDCKYIRPTY